jgi:Asp-tRNA(Asn)/Glu-tRNA(Gln) amidotransferase C subunit
MSYGRTKANENVDVEKARWLTELLELDVSPDELEALTAALSNQLSSINVLEKFDLTNVSPILKMDARWHE